MNTINFTKEDILSVIRKLNRNEAYGHDHVSIRMLQICDKAVCKPIYFIFPFCMESGIFPTKWKMANMVPNHKQDEKQDV